VIVRDGAVVGEGWHARAGEPHAEVHALQHAGARARGATAYVSLEPCCHHGRTPPCSDALIAAGVARVVAAMPDPNPKVAGEGAAQLRAAGIEVEIGLMESAARALNPGFASRMTRGRPWLRLKLAASLDGRTALADGASRWITGPAARRDVQHWRARSSAILTGIGTALADDPSLTVRELDIGRQPARVVVDSRLRLPAGARLLGLPGQVIVAAAADDPGRRAALRATGAEVLNLPDGRGGVDLTALMAALAQRDMNEVLVEAGERLSGALLAAGLVDELLLYLAPHALGSDARGLFAFPALTRMDQRIGLNIVETRMIGPDLRILARPVETSR
jgi:diaminohydroxyphosphoribosylaminopyrimidine deaminase/5-amino-6-(5-phosphoribosylamino)uracil reductase